MTAPDRIFRDWKNAEVLVARLEGHGFAIPGKYSAFVGATSGVAAAEWSALVFQSSDQFVRSMGEPAGYQAMLEKVQAGDDVIVYDLELRERFSVIRTDWKRAEATRNEPLARNWPEKKSHLRSVVQQLAVDAGFKRSRKGFIVRIDEEWSLHNDVDVGRLGSTIQQLVLHSQLEAQDGTCLMFLPWNTLVHGMACYNHSEDPEVMVWGIRAHLRLVSEFADLVREAKQRSA